MGKINLASNNSPDQSVWDLMKQEAAAAAVKEPALSSLLHGTILEQDSLGSALINHLSEKLATAELTALKLRRVLSEP